MQGYQGALKQLEPWQGKHTHRIKERKVHTHTHTYTSDWDSGFTCRRGILVTASNSIREGYQP